MTYSVKELYEMREQLKEVDRLIAEYRETKYPRQLIYTIHIKRNLKKNEFIPPEVKRHYVAALKAARGYEVAEKELPRMKDGFDKCESQYKTTGTVSNEWTYLKGLLSKWEKELSNFNWQMSTSLNVLKDFFDRPERNSRVTEESNSVQKAKIPSQVRLESKFRIKPRKRSFGIFEIVVAILVFLWWRNHDFSTASFENGIPVRNEHKIFGSWYVAIYGAFMAGWGAKLLRDVWRWIMK